MSEIIREDNYVLRYSEDGRATEVERAGFDLLEAYWECVGRDPSSEGYDAGDGPVTEAHVAAWLESWHGHAGVSVTRVGLVPR